MCIVMKRYFYLSVVFFIGFVHWSQSQTIVNITDYGAISSDTHVNTSAIQSAIDFVTANGGGKVIIPQGTFVSGTIYLKSNVELHLEENATLLGNLDYFDYKKTARWYGLIGAISATNIAITGKGTIDGRGGKLAKIIDDLYHAGTISDPSYNT
jgi:polygalacturonase